MQVTKFIHSCLLIEENRKKILIDPGNYTFEEKALNLDSIKNLDYLLITHEHPDHFYLPFIKEIIGKFPQVKILTNSSIVDILSKEGINANSSDDDFIEMEEVPHEKVFGINPPKNVLFRVGGILTDPGDSYSFNSTTKVLALPIQAPWGTTTAAVELAEKLKPEVFIPLHDWHWHEKAREAMYKRLEDYFAKVGIKFIPSQTGKTVTV